MATSKEKALQIFMAATSHSGSIGSLNSGDPKADKEWLLQCIEKGLDEFTQEKVNQALNISVTETPNKILSFDILKILGFNAEHDKFIGYQDEFKHRCSWRWWVNPGLPGVEINELYSAHKPLEPDEHDSIFSLDIKPNDFFEGIRLVTLGDLINKLPATHKEKLVVIIKAQGWKV